MTLQAHLIFTCHMWRAGSGTGARTGITALDLERYRFAAELRRSIYGLDSPSPAQHTGGQVGVRHTVFMLMGAGGVRDNIVRIEQAIFHDAMRIMAIGTFGMTVVEITFTQIFPRFDKI